MPEKCHAAIQAPATDPNYALAPPVYQAQLIYPQQTAYPAPPDLGGAYLAPGTLAALPSPRGRRKPSSGPLLWIAAGSGLLVGLMVVAAMVVASGTGPEGWITLLTAPARERNKVRPITAPAEDPFAKARQPKPATAPTPKAPYMGPSPEPILQQQVAAFNRLNSALAGIHDETSANQRRNEVAAAMRELGDNIDKLVEFPDLPAEMTKRLNALYNPQFDAAGEQTKREFERIARVPEAARVLAPLLRGEGFWLHHKASLAGVRQIGARLDRERNEFMANRMAALTTPLSSEKTDPYARFAEREIVEIVIEKMPTSYTDAAPPDDTSLSRLLAGYDTVYDRIRAVSKCKACGYTANNGTMRVTIAPILDIRALAAKIDFGTVTVLHVSQSLIVVKADALKIAALPPPAHPPAPLLPPPSDPRDSSFYRRNLENLSSGDLLKRYEAAHRLRSAEPKALRAEIAQALTKLLRDSNVLVRGAAFEALPVWATADEAMPLLIEMLRDSDSGQVDNAIKALAEFKDLRAVGPLCERANRFGFQVHGALRKIGTPAEPEVIKYLNHADEEIRKVAIKALGDIGTSRCVPYLQYLVRCGDFFIEAEAQRALQQVQGRSS